jgi:hypothetical protein
MLPQCSLLTPYWLGLCVLHTTYRQTRLYETLFRTVIILSKHHHQMYMENKILLTPYVYYLIYTHTLSLSGSLMLLICIWCLHMYIHISICIYIHIHIYI